MAEASKDDVGENPPPRGEKGAPLFEQLVANYNAGAMSAEIERVIERLDQEMPKLQIRIEGIQASLRRPLEM